MQEITTSLGPALSSPVHLISPSGPIPRSTFDVGVAFMEELGLQVRWEDGALTRGDRTSGVPYLAGSDTERAARLIGATEAARRSGGVLWMTRGGYGGSRTLDALRCVCPRFFSQSPVPLYGFSDGTALLTAWAQAGWPTWHAPPLSQLRRLQAPSVARLRASVFAGHVADFEDLRVLSPGRAEGDLAGGNLCVLASTCGTPWQADLAGKIVFIEDTGEPAYRIDRMFTQLRLCGALDGAAGLILGEFTAIQDDQQPLISAFFAAQARQMEIPALWGVPCGHEHRNSPLPFFGTDGWRAIIEAGLELEPEPNTGPNTGPGPGPGPDTEPDADSGGPRRRGALRWRRA